MEVANIPLQAWIWFGLIGLPASAPNLVGFTLFAVLLVQGAGFWAAKLSQVGAPGRRFPPGLRILSITRVTNPLLLATGVAYTVVAAAIDPGTATLPGVVFTVVAVLEHVDYFHVQLMHDTRADLRRLRAGGLHRSHLARDLARYSRLRTARGSVR
ncbi:hypothetical protein HKK74_11950 [Actinomadura alba]|uniref:Uncharacterized protein n=2 Tax=Actinomadura alba TaxID=406431 RepID=A0ABR7LMY2_9ACTN|nr:hypothetical protein [Actinomadura alba]